MIDAPTNPETVLRHRPPVLLVDRVAAVEPGRRLEARWRVPEDWSILAGHFPGEPIVPGVMLVEAIAQASALLAHATDPFDPATARMYLAAIERARFLERVGPGDVLDVLTRLTGRKGPLWRFEGEVRRGGVLVAAAAISAALRR